MSTGTSGARSHDDGHELEHAHPGPKTYVIVASSWRHHFARGVGLYPGEHSPILVPMLLVLSATKFATSSASTCICASIIRFALACLASDWQFGASCITALMFLFGQYPLPITAVAHPPGDVSYTPPLSVVAGSSACCWSTYCASDRTAIDSSTRAACHRRAGSPSARARVAFPCLATRWIRSPTRTSSRSLWPAPATDAGRRRPLLLIGTPGLVAAPGPAQHALTSFVHWARHPLVAFFASIVSFRCAHPELLRVDPGQRAAARSGTRDFHRHSYADVDAGLSPVPDIAAPYPALGQVLYLFCRPCLLRGRRMLGRDNESVLPDVCTGASGSAQSARWKTRQLGGLIMWLAAVSIS